MRNLAKGLVRLLSSLGLSITLLLLLGLLTWLGTLEQVNTGLFEVQKKYFESFFLLHRAGPLVVPLPGANLVLCLLFVNLLVGGVIRMRRGWSVAGIYVTHVGILLLLFAGFAKLYFSDDGHMTLYENESSNVFQSYHNWEIAIIEDLGDGSVREHLVPQGDFLDAVGPTPVTLTSPDLPFDLQVNHVTKNCQPMPKGPRFEVSVPVVDGAFLQERPQSATSETNIAGCYAAAIDRESGERQEGVLWGADRYPWTVSAGGREFAIDLRHERYALPFTVRLDKFTKEDHPRINMPKVFSSDVTVTEEASSRPLKISMNEPMRDRGYVLYQSSWGPSNARPGEPLYSTLSVVRNPVDQYPLYACIVIAAGLLFHFSRKLSRYVVHEVRRS